MAFISLRNVTFRYPDQRRDALRDVSLEIERGEFVAILGGDGSGKSTLCKTLNGLIPRAVKGEFSGEVLIDGRSTGESPNQEIVGKVGLSLQDPEMQIFTDSVEEEVAFGPENLGIPVDEIDARVSSELSMLELGGLRNKNPTSLSGGQKQRLAIASVLAMMPEVLVFDEPMSMLDPRGRKELLGIIERLRKERGTTVVVTGESAEEISSQCDRIILLDHGSIVKIGASSQILISATDLRATGVVPPQLLELSEALDGIMPGARLGRFYEESEAIEILRKKLDQWRMKK